MLVGWSIGLSIDLGYLRYLVGLSVIYMLIGWSTVCLLVGWSIGLSFDLVCLVYLAGLSVGWLVHMSILYG